MKKMLFTALSLAIALAYGLTATAQKQAPENWFNLDPKKDKVYGVSTERAYTELLQGKNAKPVVVAVIDGGTDIYHEDLKSVLWTNPGEIAGNKIDDDKNGYVDDINGWSFISGPGGEVKEDNLEVTRLYRTYSAKYAERSAADISQAEQAEYERWKEIKAAFEENLRNYRQQATAYSESADAISAVVKKIGKFPITADDVKAFTPQNDTELQGKQILSRIIKKDALTKESYDGTMTFLKSIFEYFDKQVKYYYNVDFDPRPMVGDNYTNSAERIYGDNRVKGPEAGHGTHVAGIIAADRNNNVGILGVCNSAKIMVLRVVPDGDERDKDVANAIRYAADNGARVINMSFGKAWSYDKKAVDEAVQYAISKNVLLIHAAGNDSKNTDVEPNFPNDRYQVSTTTADAWIEVGASSWQNGKRLTAEFSNYAAANVDLFAPGYEINSCAPDSEMYAVQSGTSMAAPVTSGVAALVLSYYPTLTNVQVKEILMKSVVPVNGKVLIPGERKKKTKMKNLCVSGGIVNVYQALQLAEQMAGPQK